MKFYPSKQEAEEILRQGDYQSIALGLTMEKKMSVAEIYPVLKSLSRHVFVLESCEDVSGYGRYSFLGFDPSLELACRDGELRINSGTKVALTNVRPHEYIRQIIAENKSPRLEALPPFTGGLVGYFAYDFIKYSEPKLEDMGRKNGQAQGNDEGDFQDVDLMLFKKIIAVDHLEQKVVLLGNVDCSDFERNYTKISLELESLENILLNAPSQEKEQGKLTGEFEAAFSEEEFCAMVEKAKRNIYEGDIFQVVLSNRLSAPYEGSLFPVFEQLKQNNPSPYMFYFSSDNVEMTGASPETLVRLEGEKVLTYPLAGTKPRGKTKEEDMDLEQELLNDEKECAEHNMLVDLGRNDLGKISDFGTVKVEQYMKIERFSHVMHIGSTVCGKIRQDKDALDALEAVLPAGTLSGAPKIRACEIIDEAENLKRGVYGGAIGYFDFSGNMDTCIAIRLIVKKNGKIYVRSGAGIVADSNPKSEYNECIHKAMACVKALQNNK